MNDGIDSVHPEWARIIDRVLPWHCYRWPKDELEDVLEAFERTQARTFLEIGTFKGATSAAVALAFPEARVITVDLADPTKSKFNPSDRAQIGEAHRALGVADRIEQWWIAPGFFDLVSYVLRTAEDAAPDLAFIDGDHSTDAVLRDLRTVAPYICEGGSIVVHDYTSSFDKDRPHWTIDVARAVDTFLDENPDWKSLRLGGWLVELYRVDTLGERA